MFSSRFHYDSCRECTDFWNTRNGAPPCLRVMSQGDQGLIAVRHGEIGGSMTCCPCIISYTELKTYMTGGAGAVRMNTEAQTLMALIHKRMAADSSKRWMTDPSYIGYLEHSTSHNNFRGYLVAKPPDVPANMNDM